MNPKKILALEFKCPTRPAIFNDQHLIGFDAPILHTMYIDKPLRDHNLIFLKNGKFSLD